MHKSSRAFTLHNITCPTFTSYMTFPHQICSCQKMSQGSPEERRLAETYGPGPREELDAPHTLSCHEEKKLSGSSSSMAKEILISKAPSPSMDEENLPVDTDSPQPGESSSKDDNGPCVKCSAEPEDAIPVYKPPTSKCFHCKVPHNGKKKKQVLYVMLVGLGLLADPVCGKEAATVQQLTSQGGRPWLPVTVWGSSPIPTTEQWPEWHP